jgi:LEA14-like dessication related protein
MPAPLARSLLALALAALSGCALFQQLASQVFEKPTLTFKSARLSDVSLAGATIDLVFDVENPNAEGLTLASTTDYVVTVEGKQLVAGRPPQGITIPARGKGEVTLPAAVRFADLGASIAALLGQRSVAWAAQGHVGVQTPLGAVTLPFSKEGRLDLPRVPDVTVGSPSVKEISFSGATLEVPLTVENVNSFPLPLGAVAATLRIAGSEVGTLQTAELGTLQGNGKQTLAVPLRVRFAEALSAAKAIADGSAHVTVQGELRSGGAAVPFALERDVTFTKP